MAVVLYPKDTEKWKQFTTISSSETSWLKLFCIPKILKNESNSQLQRTEDRRFLGCFVSQRYWKMKAIHNVTFVTRRPKEVVLYPKDTEKWKQFTTKTGRFSSWRLLFCIPKILKNESNSQRILGKFFNITCCFVSQRYWKMKAIHNYNWHSIASRCVVLYPKDTEKWKQFTTLMVTKFFQNKLFCIPKILKNESNSQRKLISTWKNYCCFVSQRYWKMKAIHNWTAVVSFSNIVVLYPKDTEKWKQFTTLLGGTIIGAVLFCIPKILKNESNSQQITVRLCRVVRCFVSQRYWKMKAIHNISAKVTRR